jgi:hypothetical protein
VQHPPLAALQAVGSQAQLPPEQIWPDEHAIPQPPQWRLSVFVFTLQPFVGLEESQFAQPDAQFPPHAPSVQVGVMLFVGQPWSQLPHLFTLVCRSKQVLPGPSLGQYVSPPLQVHVPAVHVALAASSH